MILYSNTRSMVRSPDCDTNFFKITAGVLHRWHTRTLHIMLYKFH